MLSRPPVPADLQRRLLIEAGHRCAIPTCRATGPLQIEHIDDWARVKEHKFDNMIVLCANCHGRKGSRRGQIDRKSLRQYKVNLAVVNSRYGELERRVLDHFAMVRPRKFAIEDGLAVLQKRLDAARSLAGEIDESELDRGSLDAIQRWRSFDVQSVLGDFRAIGLDFIEMARGMQFLLSYLVQDGYLERVDNHERSVIVNGVSIVMVYRLTEVGKGFVERWKTAQPLDDPA